MALFITTRSVNTFNSIKVRLKRLIFEGAQDMLAFQFHKGAIETHAKSYVCQITFLSIP